ncbi:MAG: T9SS type A sorting domain-containing protein [Flavobacteriales bacterium]|nr:T9SS type A sorting domain-containing protein [Flavobacteriales bacterium]
MRHTIVPCFLFFALACTGQQYLGVQTWGGTDSDQLNALALDAQDRIFALGGFRGTADMDPGPGSTQLTAIAGQDIFLSRFTADAQFEWSMQLGGTGHDHAQALAVQTDAVMVGGEFAGTLNAQGVELISNGSSDALLARFATNGALVWAISAGSTGSDYINDVAVDAAGNIIAIGYFQGTVDFDPGPNTFPVSAGGSDAMFLWKLSPAGELVWVRTWNGTSSENGMAVAVGAADDIWIGGGYFGTLDLDPGVGSTTVSAPGFEQQAFIAHLDADGAFLFGGHMGGNGSDGVHDIKLDATGAVIAVGAFGSTGDFDPGAGDVQLPHLGGPDSFVLKLSATGQLVHAGAVASAGYDQPRAVEVGPTGGIMITGGFDGVVDLNPGAPVVTFASNGISDVYVVLLDSALNYREGAAFGGSGQEDGTSIAWSASGRRFVGGLFEYVVDFDPSAGIDYASSILNTRDAFLTRLCSAQTIEQISTIAEGDSLFVAGAWQFESGTYADAYTAASGCDSVIVTQLTVEVNTGLTDELRSSALHLYPVPAQDRLTIATDRSAQGQLFEVIDATGRIVLQQVLTAPRVNTISLHELAPGIHVARLSGAHGTEAVFIKER